MNENDRELISEFVTETLEHLSNVESDLMEITDPAAFDDETINAIFRAIHSVKGAAGFFGFEAINKLSHKMENLLMKVRDKVLPLTADSIDVLLDGTDLLNNMTKDLNNAEQVDAEEVLSKLALLIEGKSLADAQGARKSDKAKVPAEEKESEPPKPEEFTLKYAPIGPLDASQVELLHTSGKHLFKMEIPLSFYGSTGKLGEAKSLWERKGIIHSFEIQGPYPTSLDAAVEWDTKVEVWVESGFDKKSAPKELDVLPSKIKEVVIRPQKIPVATPVAPKKAPTVEPEKQTTDPPKAASPKPAPERKEMLKPPEGEPKGGKKAEKLQIAAGAEDTVRVKTSLLNSLMEIAGELVLSRNQLLRILKSKEDSIPGLSNVLHQVDSVTTGIQEQIMKTRLQRIGNLFKKFPRVIHKLSKKLGKDVELELNGNEVELDKTILENLSDILTHLVRNSMDHGLETPEERVAVGKPPKGTITLSAYHEGGMINIDIEDDGRGIDYKKIGRLAVGKGLLSEEEVEKKTEQELLNYLFAPGFSTAKRVTDVSGRGVGMDVVRKNIEKLNGSISITTRLGKGTTTNLKLPLTLAIIPSLIIEASGHTFALPQVALEEAIRIKEGDASLKIEEVLGQQVLRHRGSLLPLVKLSSVLGLNETWVDSDGIHREEKRSALSDERGEPARERRASLRYRRILVLRAGRYRYGLIVDRIMDNEEIVVKPLSTMVKTSPCFSGATILGDGTIAVILDIMGILIQSKIKIHEINEFKQDEQQLELAEMREKQSLLCFDNGSKERFSIPLNLVRRVEEVTADQIEVVGDKQYITLGENYIPVIRLERFLDVNPPDAQKENFYVILPKLMKHPVGIVCHNILDVLEIHVTLDTETIQMAGVVGSTLIEQHIYLVLDIYKLFQMAEPDLHKESFGDDEIAFGDQPRILLVEDTPFFRTVERTYLEEAGFHVKTAAHGQEAWDLLLEDQAWDLVVSDIVMPFLDGWELVKKIKGTPATEHLPVIAVTSVEESTAVSADQKALFERFEKKLDRERLLRAVYDVLKGEAR